MDLIHISPSAFVQKQMDDEDFLTYEYGNPQNMEMYGFYLSDINKAFETFRNVFIIVRNVPIAKKIIRRFPNVRSIHVYIYTDTEEAIKRLKLQGNSSDQIKSRLERIQPAWDDFLTFSNSFNEVIINNSNVLDYHKFLVALIDRYNTESNDMIEISNEFKYSLINPLIGHKSKILEKLKGHAFEKNVFLMMKFRENNVRLYSFIKKTLSDKGFNCVRADDEHWRITNDVYNPLAVLYCCKYGIALFDTPEVGNNYSPNVAYELGIMQLQKKECLILRKSTLPEPPFDLIKDVYKEYKDNLDTEDIVRDWICALAK